ncbi:MAG: hypothetical protein M3Q07_21905 [Pseudobdellovibrionaceae bacterium]|nr:hypothetical protein [Pseudobdellovibrionaceae bacterium]
MPLKGTEGLLGSLLYEAATNAKGVTKEAWEAIAQAIVDHITSNALVTGTTPNGGPMTDGKIS